MCINIIYLCYIFFLKLNIVYKYENKLVIKLYTIYNRSKISIKIHEKSVSVNYIINI